MECTWKTKHGKGDQVQIEGCCSNGQSIKYEITTRLVSTGNINYVISTKLIWTGDRQRGVPIWKQQATSSRIVEDIDTGRLQSSERLKCIFQRDWSTIQQAWSHTFRRSLSHAQRSSQEKLIELDD